MLVLADDPERVAGFVAARTDVAQFYAPYQAIGWINSAGELVGGAIFNNYNGSNVEISIAGKGAVTRQAFRDIAQYCFRQLGVRRITAHTKASNVRLINQAQRFGALHEGFRRRWFYDDDAVCLVLLPENCRW